VVSVFLVTMLSYYMYNRNIYIFETMETMYTGFIYFSPNLLFCDKLFFFIILIC